jgi:hypothetical protein
LFYVIERTSRFASGGVFQKDLDFGRSASLEPDKAIEVTLWHFFINGLKLD